MAATRNTRVVRAPRGTEMAARTWASGAALRMLMNNLDPEAAERPEDRIPAPRLTEGALAALVDRAQPGQQGLAGASGAASARQDQAQRLGVDPDRRPVPGLGLEHPV